MDYVAGGAEEVDWILAGTARGLTIGSAIPPEFESYGTVVIPDYLDEQHRQDASLVETLVAHTAQQPWWLGYLMTGGATIPVSKKPWVPVYGGWRYVLVEAGPEEALNLRQGEDRTLPDLMFPLDRTWLVSTLWDDDWRCFGAATPLAKAIHQTHGLVTRAVGYDWDATPPGHIAR